MAREPSRDRDALPPVPPAKHLLSLKVLRAARPRLAVQDGPYLEDNSLTDGALSRAASSSTDFAASSILSLPSAFGTIYLGQEFHGVLAVQNDSGVGEGLEESKGKTAQEVQVKVEMQTQNNKATLAELGPKAMARGDAVDLSVKHEIREQGQTILPGRDFHQ